MRHLIVIRIKNSDFDYTKYGLKNSYFSIDISNSFSYSKNIGVTQYALLDGTTRVENISREPATFNLQGLLGEVRAGGSPENFVYATAEKNRLQNQMDLLEALRDQAIFLDMITDERTYKNCIITGLSFGKTRIGQIDAQINIREIIVFGDEITTTTTTSSYDITDYEQGLILDEFEMNAITDDEDLVNELYRIMTSSTLSTPFIILLGPVDSNPDAVLPTYSFTKKATSLALPVNIGNVVVASDTNALTIKMDAAEIMTGAVAGGNYLHVTMPQKALGSNLYKTRITKNSLGQYEYMQTPDSFVHVRLLNNDEAVYSAQKGELLKTPLYSDMVNGIHYLSTAGSPADIIASDKYGVCFIRKQKNNRYSLVPNILGNDSRGFLYVATFEKAEGSVFKLYPILVYIQPRAWESIKTELKRVWAESTYFKTKTLVI